MNTPQNTGALIIAGFEALLLIAQVAIEKASILRDSAMRSREWTPEQETAAAARIAEIQNRLHWTIEPDPARPPAPE